MKLRKRIKAAIAGFQGGTRVRAGNLFGTDYNLGAGNNSGFRSIRGTLNKRDMFEQKLREQQVRAYHFYRTSPIAFRAIEIYANFVVGEGFGFKAEDPNVQRVLEEHWEDPNNDWDSRQHNFVRELSGNGELFLPVSTDQSGRVTIGYIDPLDVLGVKANPLNATQALSITVQIPGGKEVSLEVVRVQGEHGRLTGEVMPFFVNKSTNATRGNSDLLPVLDWIDLHEGFLISMDKAARIKLAVAILVTMEDGTPDDIDKLEQSFATMEPGSIRIINEKVTVENLALNLGTSELVDQARVLKRQIAVGIGIPDHWLSEGSETNLACHSEDTETLVRLPDGSETWLDLEGLEEHGKDIEIGTFNPDSGSLEYHKPHKFYVYDYEGDMVYFRNKMIDILVTPNHRMYLKRERNDKAKMEYEIIRADKVKGNRWHIPVAMKWKGVDVEAFRLPALSVSTRTRAILPEVDIPMDLWLEFLGYFVSEGHANKKVNLISISQKKEPGRSTMVACMERLPFKFTATVDKKSGVTHWQAYDAALNKWLRDECGYYSQMKRLPDFVHTISSRQCRILLDALILGDGSIDNRPGRRCRSYYTTSEELRDQVQLVALKAGWQAKESSAGGYVSPNPMPNGDMPRHRHPCYRLLFNHRTETVFTKKAVSKKAYKGRVYCYEVPNHLFVTRRKGKIAVTHNTASAMGLPTVQMFRARQKLWKGILSRIFNYVIDEAVTHGTLHQDVDRRFVVTAPNVWSDDTATIASSLLTLGQSMMIGVQQGLIEQSRAKELFEFITEQLGFGATNFEERKEGELGDVEEKPTGMNGLHEKHLDRFGKALDGIEGGTN